MTWEKVIILIKKNEKKYKKTPLLNLIPITLYVICKNKSVKIGNIRKDS